MGQSAGSAQRFLSVHSSIYNHFNIQRHLNSRNTLRQFRDTAAAEWRNVVISSGLRKYVSRLSLPRPSHVKLLMPFLEDAAVCEMTFMIEMAVNCQQHQVVICL
jgi:hypothetical protein